MNLERETISIVTPVGGVKVVLKAWITGRERREINKALIDNSELVDGKYLFKASKINETKDAALNLIITSVGDKTTDFLDDILDMHSDDYDFIIKTVDEITSEKKEEESKKK